MVNDEIERNAYNAAFYELGFRWHWDRDTYERLQRYSPHGATRIRHYLETHQPHLLTAYDATFLINAIEEKKVEYRHRGTARDTTRQMYFDWTQTLGSELGA